MTTRAFQANEGQVRLWVAEAGHLPWLEVPGIGRSAMKRLVPARG